MRKNLLVTSLALSLLLALPTACQPNSNTTGAPANTTNASDSPASVDPENTSSESGSPVTADDLTIYTSFYPIYDFTKQIVGDTANVVNLMPAGSDLHDFEPSAADLVALHQADVLIYQGAGLEPWLENVKATLEQDSVDITFIEAAKNIPLLGFGEEDDHDHEDDDHGDDDHEDDDHDDDDHAGHNHGSTDPHVWLNPKNAILMLENITNKLSALNPSDKKSYEANLATAKSSLEALDAEFQMKLGESSGKSFIVTHEAFAYLADAYGLTQYGITGVGAEQEPSPDRMVSLVALAREEGIKVIYYEATGSDKIAQTLASEVGAEVMALNTIESPGDAEVGDYLALMRQNLENLVAGFAD